MIAADLFSWSERAPSPLPRAGCAVGVVDGALVAAGGTYWQEGQKFWSDRVDRYDALENRWTSLPSLPQARGDAPAATVGNVFNVLGGGTAGAAETSVYAYSHARWTIEQRMTLPQPRRSSAAVVMGETIYLIGGLTGTGSDFATATSTMWSMSPGSSWRPCAAVPGPVRFNAAVGAFDYRIIVAGGCTPEAGSVRNLDDILIYDTRADTWSTLGRLPYPLRGACGLADDSRLLVIGGYTDRFLTCIQAVDFRTGDVSVVGELPLALADTRFVALRQSVFGVTGENGIKQRFPGTLESNPPH
ncbi:MAG: kelch repeat-containing protein [Opitutus sp.]